MSHLSSPTDQAADQKVGQPTGWRIVFFGTPEFAVPSLQALVNAGEHVVGVVTQPDKPAGRGRHLTPPPVKSFAENTGIPVVQPEKVRGNAEFLRVLRGWQPDVIVVVAYGKILPREILEIPPHGCINVHASLLPRYRGAAPIQWALIRGESESGITIMLMTEEMDAGPILLQRRVSIASEETYGELQKRLAHLGAACLLEALHAWHKGVLQPRLQDAAQVSFAPLIRSDLGKIDWQKPAAEIAQLVRGLSPSPGAYFLWKGRRVKVYRARVQSSEEQLRLDPGTIVRVDPRLEVACGDGVLELVEIQVEGRRQGKGSEVARGLRWQPGHRLA
ncbi:MAG: methionyl-tRNA formyltransferase [Candidatus Binatia bacterium]|nr:methionyl-tRNA formyltransferase [Candidatus Binatia bacterium]